MAKKYKYKIGDWVEVRNVVRFVYVDQRRKMIRESSDEDFQSFIGQIVGYKQCFTGRVYNDDGYKYFSQDKAIGVWLVRQGLINKSLYVRENNLSLCPSQDHVLPKKFMLTTPWTDAAKEVMRQEAMHMKRDKKGRFLKTSAKKTDVFQKITAVNQRNRQIKQLKQLKQLKQPIWGN